MTYRFLGRSGLQVSAISLGGWLTSGGQVDRGMYQGKEAVSPRNTDSSNTGRRARLNV